MTTQTELLDADLLEVLEQHLTTRRELLKRVKGELSQLSRSVRDGWEPATFLVEDVMDVMDRLIAEAKLPGSK